MERKFEIVSNEHRKHPAIEVVLPERADSGSCAYDFRSLEDKLIKPGEKHLFFTDVKVAMFFDNVLELNTRSGNGAKHGIVLGNTIGYIDSSYYENPDNDGNIGICLKNTGTEDFVVAVGDRIAQGKFSKFLITADDKWKGTKGGTRQGGFGSTGSK